MIGSSQADPLALASAELVRELRDVRGVETDQAKQFCHPRRPLRAGADAVNDQRFFDDGPDAHPGIE